MYTLKHPNKIENPLRPSLQPWWKKYCLVCIPVFSSFFTCFPDILDEEGVLMILDELEVQNWSFTNLGSREDFSSKFRCRRAADIEFPAFALHVTDNYACGLRPGRRTRARLCPWSRILNLSTKHPAISRLVQKWSRYVAIKLLHDSAANIVICFSKIQCLFWLFKPYFS